MSIEPLRDALDDALTGWAAPARPHLPSALFWAEAHPFDSAVLCQRLDGHCGPHSADGSDPWATDIHEETP